MSGRLPAVVIGASLVALLCVPAASAKIYFGGIPETAVPGTVVKASVAGCEAAPACGPFVRGTLVFLARARPGRLNFNVPPKPRWLVGTANVRGKLTFTLPRVRDGEYRLIARLRFGSRFQYLPASNVFTIHAPVLPPEQAEEDSGSAQDAYQAGE